MHSDEGAEKLRALIGEEVGRWSLDHRRGVRPFDLAEPDVVAERAYRNLAGYGPLGPLLEDDDVWEIMINAPDQIFAKRHLGRSGYHDEVFHDDDHVLRTLTKILDDASASHRKLDPAEGLQDAQLDNGSRMHIVHNDVSSGGHVMVNIRKFTGVAFRHLDQLVAREMLSAQAASYLAACVRAGLTMVIAGAPGSGKTTLMSCCTAELDPSLRVVVAEEVFEADVPLPNVASMQTRAARPDRPAVDLRKLVAGFLRMAPDVAVVGEVRDREALPLLLTLSSGVKGFTTIHAGSARQALTRLRFICQLSDSTTPLPLSALNSLVSESIDIVVHCSRTPVGPRVTEIVAVEDLAAGPDAAQFTVTQVFSRTSPDGSLTWSGNLPVRADRALAAIGLDQRELVGASDAAGARW
jgi:pilus assembly protein CpaF